MTNFAIKNAYQILLFKSLGWYEDVSGGAGRQERVGKIIDKKQLYWKYCNQLLLI